MWRKREDPHLKCDAANFDVPRGSLLKYAVKLRNWELLMTAADEWRVNLNAVDNSDHRTLLDYVATEIERTAKDPRYNGTLRTYFGVLRKLGAKHAREL